MGKNVDVSNKEINAEVATCDGTASFLTEEMALIKINGPGSQSSCAAVYDFQFLLVSFAENPRSARTCTVIFSLSFFF